MTNQELSKLYERLAAGEQVKLGVFLFWREGGELLRTFYDEGSEPSSDPFPTGADELAEYLVADLGEGHRDLAGLGLNEEENEVTAEMRRLVAEALGGKVSDEDIMTAVAELDQESTAALKEKLARLKSAFEEAGGRGVEMADEIDQIRTVLAVRKEGD